MMETEVERDPDQPAEHRSTPAKHGIRRAGQVLAAAKNAKW